MAKKTPKTADEFVDYRISQLEETTGRRFDTIEKKIDAIAAVSPTEFAEFKVFITKELAKKVDNETANPYFAFIKLIATSFAVAIIGAIATLILRK